MPGLGTLKILVDEDVLRAIILSRSPTKVYKQCWEVINKLHTTIPPDAVLMEVRPIEREPGKLMMVWSHPSFPSDEIPHASPEPKVPADWDYIR